VAQSAGHVIENLSAVDFARRLSQLGGKDNAVFAHDALSYDPIAKQIDDPLNALSFNEVRLVSRPTKTPEALAVAMRGTGDARAAALPEGEDFANWKAQLVRVQVTSKAAQPIAAVLVRELPAFAALAGTDDVKSALMTPLISSAMKPALGMTAKQAIGEFDRVREIFGQSYSDPGVWLYVVLGKQVKKDTRGWIDPALLEDVHWREAFDTASKIETAFQSPELKPHV
jgi:alkylation response protein AidB-like acyl-CoA dehydrogenase